jgi:hypothetical protein
MTDKIEKVVEEFKKLKFEKRKEIVLNLLKTLKEKNKNFEYAYTTLSKKEILDDGLLERVYKELIILSNKKSEEIKNLDIKKIDKIK